MKKQNKLWICMLMLMAVLLILTNGCKKDQNSLDNPTNGKTTAVFNSTLTYGTLTDQAGNIYKTVIIGTQTWMAENLRTTKYRNGDPVPEVTNDTMWNKLSAGAYCNTNNTRNSDTIATFGRLYNWYAVADNRNLAPDGWHIPSDAEWTILTDYLGGESIAAGKLKEAGTSHWGNPNLGATNETGFTALPGASRETFDAFGDYGGWWSSSEYSTYYAWERDMYYLDSRVYRGYVYEKVGYSVRCVKD